MIVGVNQRHFGGSLKSGELMMEASLDDVRLKSLLKETLLELLEERREEFSELLLEVLEDLALSRAIREGEGAGLADKKEILKIIAGRV
jgi:hypothetical protein